MQWISGTIQPNTNLHVKKDRARPLRRVGHLSPRGPVAYHSAPHSSLGNSPYEMLFGSQPRGPLEILKRSWTKPSPHPEELSVHAYVNKLKARLEDIRSIASTHLAKLEKNKRSNITVEQSNGH